MKPTKRKSEHYAGFTLRKIERPGRPDRWQVEEWEDGRLRRWTFATKVLAQKHAESRRGQLNAIGRQADQLTEEQRADAVKALNLLHGAASLTAAAECWLRYYRPPEGTVNFSALVELYLIAAAKRNLRPRSLTDLRVRLTRMAKDLGDMPSTTLDTAILEGWLDAQKLSHANRRNFRTVIHSLFSWASQTARKKKHRSAIKYVPDNPASDLNVAEMDEHMPATFMPAQVEAIMRAAEKKESRALPYLALAFFAGIRPTELVRLTWGDVDLSAGTVTVRPEVAKKRRSRIVRLSDNALRWLLSSRPEDAEAGTRIVSSPMTLRRMMKTVRTAAKVATWPADVARHCFASYHLALHGNISLTCLDMGHTEKPQVLFEHYRNLATKDQAAAFFAIMPAKEKSELRLHAAG